MLSWILVISINSLSIKFSFIHLLNICSFVITWSKYNYSLQVVYAKSLEYEILKLGIKYFIIHQLDWPVFFKLWFCMSNLSFCMCFIKLMFSINYEIPSDLNYSHFSKNKLVRNIQIIQCSKYILFLQIFECY